MSSLIRIENQYLTVEVSPLGAEMQSITSHDGRSWLWNGDASFWTGRSPVLFPIVGKAPDDTLIVNGQGYPMGQHGFARRQEFTLAASNETYCRFALASSEATRAVYPFDFDFSVRHSLEDRTLIVSVEVVNHGDHPMPFGFGFHPAFAWPLPGGQGLPHTITLDSGAEPALHRLKGGLLSDEPLPSPFHAGRLLLDHSQYDADAMIFPEDAGPGLTYAAEGGPSLKFHFENLPNLALWTKPGAPFLCIEPWHGTAAIAGGSRELADRPYTTLLGLGQSIRFGFSVTFDV
ncbi:aldose 1-epimerase family protein [Pararhizobium sp.]|uniref:aldose 1-epimerase family protein n=1 Tax=Pararhizobium sp. TaxID=1977563 RepID=UPI00271E5E21|nr:aldose 1-epimerase family protein [Pararhizobium sp.]MDO9414873.1 aldose 1-epimerase family protein [Pararhizobium sp.]